MINLDINSLPTELLVGISLTIWLFLGGCDLLGDNDGPTVDVGIVAWVTDASGDVSVQSHVESEIMEFKPLSAPDTVQVGQSFEVEVQTAGPNSCYEADRVETEEEALLIEITPYDRNLNEEGFQCPQEPIIMQRTLNYEFDTPGEGLIRLNGQRVIGNDFSNRDDTVIEHELTVVE